MARDDLYLMETMSNASGKWSSTSRTSQGPAFLHKIKYKQGKIKAKAMAVESVLKQPEILTNAKLLGQPGVRQRCIEQSTLLSWKKHLRLWERMRDSYRP